MSKVGYVSNSMNWILVANSPNCLLSEDVQE